MSATRNGKFPKNFNPLNSFSSVVNPPRASLSLFAALRLLHAPCRISQIQIALLKIRAKQIILHAKQGASLHPMFERQFGADSVLPHQCDAYGTKWLL